MLPPQSCDRAADHLQHAAAAAFQLLQIREQLPLGNLGQWPMNVVHIIAIHGFSVASQVRDGHHGVALVNHICDGRLYYNIRIRQPVFADWTDYAEDLAWLRNPLGQANLRCVRLYLYPILLATPLCSQLLVMEKLVKLQWAERTFRYLCKRGCGGQRVCAAAAEVGSIRCLQIAGEQYAFNESTLCHAVASNDVVFMSKVCAAAPVMQSVRPAENAVCVASHMALQYVMEHGCRSDAVLCNRAAERNDVECLRYLQDRCGCCSNQVIELAAKSNALACLKFAHRQGGWWDPARSMCICTHALHASSLASLRYAHEQMKCSMFTFESAAASSELQVSQLCIPYGQAMFARLKSMLME
eukprot:gene10732-biopygen5376